MQLAAVRSDSLWPTGVGQKRKNGAKVNVTIIEEYQSRRSRSRLHFSPPLQTYEMMNSLPVVCDTVKGRSSRDADSLICSRSRPHWVSGRNRKLTCSTGCFRALFKNLFPRSNLDYQEPRSDHARPSLFNRHTLREVPRLIHICALQYGHMVGKQL